MPRSGHSSAAKQAYDARRYLANRDAFCARNAANYAAHRAERRLIGNLYEKEHREEASARWRKWAEAHPERAREQAMRSGRKWRAKNHEAMRAAASRWARNHPEARRTYEARRRARRRGVAASAYSAADWKQKCALLGNVCIYCGEAKPLTRDHKIPLVRGGSDDISNIVPACHSCNSKKGTRTAREYLAVVA